MADALETMPAETVWAAANEVPPEWYGGDLSEMEALVEKLLARRSRIRELIEGFGNSDRKPFPKWGRLRINETSEGETWNCMNAGDASALSAGSCKRDAWRRMNGGDVRTHDDGQ